MPVWLRSKNLWMNSALLLALIAVSAAQFQRTQALSWIAWVLLLICLPLWLLLTAGWGVFGVLARGSLGPMPASLAFTCCMT